MKSLVLSSFTEIWLPVTALVIFVSVFAVMLLHVFKKTSKEVYHVVENLPFDEGVKK